MLNGDYGYVGYKHSETCHSPIVCVSNVVSHRTASSIGAYGTLQQIPLLETKTEERELMWGGVVV